MLSLLNSESARKSLFFGNLTYHSGRYATHDCKVGDILSDHSTSCHNRFLTNHNPGQEGHAGSDSGAHLDRDSFVACGQPRALVVHDRIIGSHTEGCHEYIVTDIRERGNMVSVSFLEPGDQPLRVSDV